MSDLNLLPALKQQIRREKQRLRRNLSKVQQRTAAHQLARRVASSLPYLRARRVALYWPCQGEINPLPLLSVGRSSLPKQWYLPVVGQQSMVFYPYEPGQSLIPNRYGIPEPPHGGSGIPVWMLDLVLVPLVAFDANRNRLGMGGGFYDRCFQSSRTAVKAPYLMGVAHDIQIVDDLPTEEWDITLQAVATERRWY